MISAVIIFIVLLKFIACKIHYIDYRVCDDMREKAVLELFKEKETVITLGTSDFNCMSTLPLMHFKNIENIPVDNSTTRSIMIDFDITTGLIYRGSATNLLTQVFPKIVNPKIRFLIFLTETISDEIIEKIFIDAWNKYRISDIFVIIDEEFRNFNNEFSIYAYNLFINESEQRLISIEFSLISDNGFKMLKEFKEKKFNNLNNYELRVVLFTFMMVCEGEVDSLGNYIMETLRFQDAETLKILSKHANFSIKFVKSPDGIKHGYQTSNKTFTGSLGMIEYENADLASNARLVAEYNTSNTLCLFPTTTTKLKFSVPKKYLDEVNLLSSIYNFLDNYLKVSILVIFVTLPLILFIIEYIHGVRQKSMFEAITSKYIMFYAIMTFVSVKLPSIWTSRWIVGGAILFWLIIGNTYSGKMIEFLNTDWGLKQIESINQLMETNLIIKIPYPMATLFEGNFQNTSKSHQFINRIVEKSREMEGIGDKMAFIDVHNMGDMIRSRKYAMLFLENLIDYVEKTYYDEKGNNIMTHIEETPYEYYYAISVPKTSPFVQCFNKIMMRSFEAGISKYQMSMAMIENDLLYIRRIKEGKVPHNDVKSISLNQVYSIFFLYLISISMCFCIFIFEVAFDKFRLRARLYLVV